MTKEKEGREIRKKGRKAERKEGKKAGIRNKFTGYTDNVVIRPRLKNNHVSYVQRIKTQDEEFQQGIENYRKRIK